MKAFEKINRGYNNVFQPNKLSIGMVVPIEHYPNSPIPTMKNHLERVQKIEELGFKSAWLRDVPFQVPSFGDAGQLFDPFTYMGFLAGQTSEIALAMGSIALPLHHPTHVAKFATSIDQLSNGRLILGVASGDRPAEFPAMGIDFEKRGEMFRESFNYIRKAQEDYPTFTSKNFGNLDGNLDILPKAKNHKIPMMVTGYSQQSLEWNAQHGDGWMSYPKNLLQQELTIAQWRDSVDQLSAYNKPFMQPLYVDLQANDDFQPQPIHLGFKIGAHYLTDYLHNLKSIGVNHVAFNLRFNTANINHTLERLATKVLSHFHTTEKETTLA